MFEAASAVRKGICWQPQLVPKGNCWLLYHKENADKQKSPVCRPVCVVVCRLASGLLSCFLKKQSLYFHFLLIVFPQKGNFSGISIQLIGGFQVKGKLSQGRMIDDANQSFFSDISFSDTGVAILVSAQRIQAVV